MPGKPDLPVTYELVEADAVQASHLAQAGFQKNPHYALENERRYHDEPGSKAKVLENALRLDPAFLLSSVDANHGAPVVDQQGNVLGGNGRAMSIQYAYDGEGKSATAYRDALRANADALGLNPASIESMERPMLVRRVRDDISPEARQALVTSMNDDFKDSREKKSEGVTRGERLSPTAITMLAEGMKAAEAGSLREFFDSTTSLPLVDKLMQDGVLQKTERNALVAADGLLNPDGKTKVEAALRVLYVNGRETLSALPDGIKAKMDVALPHMLLADNVGGEWAILQDVREANDLIVAYKGSGHKEASTFLNQVDMMQGKSPSQGASPVALGIFTRALEDKKAEFAEHFKRYAKGAELSGDNNALAGVGKPRTLIIEERFGVKLPAELKREAKGKPVASASGAAPQQKEATKNASVQGAGRDKIQDFGEKIGGARKDVWTEWRKDIGNLSKEDVIEKPLEKIFPEPKYDKLLSEGVDPKALALVHAVRDVVAEQKRSLRGRKQLADSVRELVEAAAKLLDSKEYYLTFVAGLQGNSRLRGVHNAASLYEAVGHAKSLSGVRIAAAEYSVLDGERFNPPKTFWTVEKEAKKSSFSNWPRVLAKGETREEAVENFKKVYDNLQITKPVKKEVSFILYHDRGKALEIMIGVKIGRNYVPLAGPFSKAAEARSHLAENKEALIEKLARMKNIPGERRDVNNPRVGEDMRGGQNVTPEMFTEAFGFRGVEFGNWVENDRRQADLNNAYDALMDLAGIIGVTPKALSLNGELGLAFGARGIPARIAGGSVPAAHYETKGVVINLTKKNGAGSLAHEWFHAVDNYFSRMSGRGGEYLSNAPEVGMASHGSSYAHSEGPLRKEIIEAWGKINKAINESGLKQRSETLDTVRSTPYWGTDIELGARAFEAYIVEKLQDNNASNDYLANIVDEKVWDTLGEATGDKKEYPYPTRQELPSIVAAFDNLFQVVEQRETDTGIALASRKKVAERPSDEKLVRVVDVDPSNISADWRNTKALLAWLREIYQGSSVTVKDDGQRIVIGRRGLEDSLKRKGEDQRKAYANLLNLLESAVYDSSTDSDERHKGKVRGQKIYYSAMRLPNGKLFAVKFKVDIPLSGEHVTYKDHKVREIEIAPVLSLAIPSDDGVQQKASGASETSPVLSAAKLSNTDKSEPGAGIREIALTLYQSSEGKGSYTLQNVNAISEVSLSILKGAVNPTSLENGALTSIAPGQFLPQRRAKALHARVKAVQRVVDALGRKAKNAAPVRVVQAFDEMPEHIQSQYAGSESHIEGVYDPRSKTVWLVADNISDVGRAAEVWAHEQVVHHGLRGMFSDIERKQVLTQLWVKLGGMSNKLISEIAERYGMNPRADAKARESVMEEFLANLAEKKMRNDLTAQEEKWWQRIVDAVLRAWTNMVRSVSSNSPSMKATDIDGLLSALGKYVMDGESQRHSEGAFSPASLRRESQTSEAVHVAWEQLQADTAAWEQQLDAIRIGEVHPRQVLTVGQTPLVLQKLGAPALNMTMTQSVLKKIGEGGKHGLSGALIRRLPALLAEPVMVFKSGTQAESLVVLLEAMHEGMPTVAAVHLGVEKGGVSINDIASVHGRSGGFGWVAGEIRAGRRLYADKTKIPTWMRGFSEDQGSRRMSGLQLPGAFVLPNDPRGVKILTEKDVVKPVRPEVDAPLASRKRGADSISAISPSSILEAGIRKTMGIAENSDIRRVMGEEDLGILSRIVSLPHWIAKQFPDFAKVYERQLTRMDERSAALKKSLESVPSVFGEKRLNAEDMSSLRDLIWKFEGQDPVALKGVEKYLVKETLANGREIIAANPAFYTAYKKWLDSVGKGTKAAKLAMLEIRKSLDADLALAHNRMAAMSEMSDDAIKEFRQSIGHVPNYFPHHRYGTYFVQAKVGKEVVYRKHFGAGTEAMVKVMKDKIVNEVRGEFPDAEWAWGKNTRLPDEVLGAPIDSEAMEQIIMAATSKIADKERAREIRETLTAGTADILKARGWNSHGIGRKGIPGFETEDISKILYDYKSGLNGWLTKMEAARDFSAALGKIDAGTSPNLWRYTSQYVKDMLRNSDRVDRITGTIKSVAFAWYLGGSIKTAFVNMTQNMVVGVPRLQMDVTGGGIMWLHGAQKAIVDRVTGNKGKGLTEEEARLVQELYGESVITDAFMEEIRGHLSGVTGATLWNKFMKVLGLPMSEVERFNRASLALAAFRAARSGSFKARARAKYGVTGRANYEQAKQFAADVVRDAHFVYGKANMPEFMRSNTAGRMAAPMYTFRTFTHNMLAMWLWALKTQGSEGATFVAKSIGATMVLGGVTALPMYATLMAICQALSGDDDDWTEAIRSWLPNNNVLRDVVCYGAPAMGGVNVGGSLKMETPLTKGLTEGKNPQEVLGESIGDIIGIPYDLLVVKPSRMLDAHSKGSAWRTLEEAAPVAIKNGMQAWRLYTEGQTTMTGRPINDPGLPGARKLSASEAFGKALGFQPVSSTKSYDAYAAGKHSDMVRSNKIDELTVLALKTYDSGEPTGRLEMTRKLLEWNDNMRAEGKPHMLINLKDVNRRVKSRRRENRPTAKAMQKKARIDEVWQ